MKAEHLVHLCISSMFC